MCWQIITIKVFSFLPIHTRPFRLKLTDIQTRMGNFQVRNGVLVVVILNIDPTNKYLLFPITEGSTFA